MFIARHVRHLRTDHLRGNYAQLCARFMGNVPTFWDPLGQDFVKAVKKLVQTKTVSGRTKRVVPMPIQRTSFKSLLQGKDACLLSSTGSGKTVAYAVPLAYRLASEKIETKVRCHLFLQKLHASFTNFHLSNLPTHQNKQHKKRYSKAVRKQERKVPKPHGLVLVPTRELALQVNDVFERIFETIDTRHNVDKFRPLRSTTITSGEKRHLQRLR